MSFFPKDFVEPKSPSKYLKLDDGQTVKIRIASEPIFFYEFWGVGADGKPKPLRVAHTPGQTAKIVTPEGADPTRLGKYVMATVIYNYTDELVQIWNISQKSIRENLVALAQNPDVGDPFGYDLSLTRKGKDMDTTYILTALLSAKNTKPLPDEIIADCKSVQLDKLLTGEDPFSIF